ncbi:hypothetical protein HDV00_010944 [Rhizophlyctis rosea]|nr:hypothetical protein HDV00_010944 [Rhizophlyctis rosea]
MLLTEIFGKMMSSRKQHELAHIFHGSLINLARRSSIFHAAASSTTEMIDAQLSLASKWETWIRIETCKRLAFVIFMMDTQHAIIFWHTPMMSAFELQLRLPADEQLWDAATPEQWAKDYFGTMSVMNGGETGDMDQEGSDGEGGADERGKERLTQGQRPGLESGMETPPELCWAGPCRR